MKFIVIQNFGMASGVVHPPAVLDYTAFDSKDHLSRCVAIKFVKAWDPDAKDPDDATKSKPAAIAEADYKAWFAGVADWKKAEAPTAVDEVVVKTTPPPPPVVGAASGGDGK
jgi:hypothetical protein